MAEPVSIAIAATFIPIVLAGIQSGLKLALDAMPEIMQEVHDTRTKHYLVKLNALFLKARTGELTEKDSQHAKRYYPKIQAVALVAENQTLLQHLEKGLLCLGGSLAVKNLIKQDDEGEPSETKTLEPDSPTLGILDAEETRFRALQILQRVRFGDCETPLGLPAPLEASASPEQNRKPNKLKTLERPALWLSVAVLPPLLFVPRIRHKC